MAPLPVQMRAAARRRVFQAGVAVAVLAAATGATAGDTQRLREVTDKWRRARASELPIAAHLRALVRSDAAFAPDTSRTRQHLASETMRRIYDGLQPLLSRDLQTQFLGLSSDSLRHVWRERYWRLRDPTPTTAENERQHEHERRVQEAALRFAAKEPPYWDDRGRIWIAFGAPDSIVEHAASVEDGLGYVPARQEWLYLNEGWVAPFERPNPRGPWRLGRSSAKLSWRPDIVRRDRERLWPSSDPSLPASALDYERLGDAIGFAEDRVLLAEGDYDGLDRDLVAYSVRTDLRARDLLRKRQEAEIDFHEQVATGGERFVVRGKPPPPLWYVFDVDVFKGPPGRMRVEVHYQLNLQDLRFAWQESLYAAAYRAEGVLLDAQAREAARDAYVERVTADAFRSTLAAHLIPGQLTFVVVEGTYRLAIRLVDEASDAQGTYVTYVDVPPLDDRRLALSDIQMATSIVYAGDDWRSRFVKKDRLIVPNPIGVVQKGRSLIGYFEIYGLTLDADSMCRYQVTYTIVPRSLVRPDGWFPASDAVQAPFVTSTFTGDGGTRELAEELRIDIAALASDAYDLVLTVRDLVAGGEATERTRFTILD